MMLLLPLQATWGMAASYCQHEQGANVGHFGHHTHKHQVAADVSGKAKVSVSDGIDVDCEVCHLGTVSMASATPTAPAVPDSVGHPMATTHSYASHIPDGPERPVRARAA